MFVVKAGEMTYRFGRAMGRWVFLRWTEDEEEWLVVDLVRAFAHYDQTHGGHVVDDDPSLRVVLGLCAHPSAICGLLGSFVV